MKIDQTNSLHANDADITRKLPSRLRLRGKARTRTTEDLDGFLTIRETAEWLGYTDRYLRMLRKEGVFPQPILIGKGKRYSLRQLCDYVERAHIRAGICG